MTKPRLEPSASIMKFLQSCSLSTLQEFELARLAAVANLEKEMKEVLRQMVNSAAEALFARMLIEQVSDPAGPPQTAITVENGTEPLDEPKAMSEQARKLLRKADSK